MRLIRYISFVFPYLPVTSVSGMLARGPSVKAGRSKTHAPGLTETGNCYRIGRFPCTYELLTRKIGDVGK